MGNIDWSAQPKDVTLAGKDKCEKAFEVSHYSLQSDLGASPPNPPSLGSSTSNRGLAESNHVLGALQPRQMYGLHYFVNLFR